MREFPKGGLIGKAVHGFQAYTQLNISIYSAYVCYFLILSIFPLLLVLLGFIRYTPLQVEHLIEMMQGLLPRDLQAQAEELILLTYAKLTSASAISLSAVTTLWSGSRGMFGLMTGLNSIYHLKETRGYFYTRIVCLFYTLAFLLLVILTLALHVFSNHLIGLLEGRPHRMIQFFLKVLNVRFLLLWAIQTGVFTAMFMVLPAKPQSFWQSFPGALLASLGWLIFSNVYSVYVDNYVRLTSIYGSVYALVLHMLWLYCCVGIFLSGGALNRFLCAGDP